jgi:hypothetical protein
LLPGEVKKWDAKWIWCEGEPVPQNFYLYCRKSFTLQGDVAQAGVEVTADSRYKLFVNGRFVGRGPARCDQRWQYYDTYDLRKFLARGENVVSVMVHQYGVPTHNNTLGRGGLLLQGEVREAKGRLTPIEWSAEPDNQAASGRAWIMGPYGKVRPHKQAFTGGRARYWVEGPGTFRVVAEG